MIFIWTVIILILTIPIQILMILIRILTTGICTVKILVVTNDSDAKHPYYDDSNSDSNSSDDIASVSMPHTCSSFKSFIFICLFTVIFPTRLFIDLCLSVSLCDLS